MNPQNKGYSYAGASTTKRAFKGYTATSGSPTEDIDYNNYTLRQRGRMAYMSQPIATSAIRTNRTNVVGIGLIPNPKINAELLGISAVSAENWEKKVKQEWKMWAEDKAACDATGVNDFYAMQQLAFISWLTSGDVFAVRKNYDETFENPYSLRIQLIEADRIRTPSDLSGNYVYVTDGKAENGNKIHDGVEIDSNGKIVAYYICNTYPYEITINSTHFQRVEAYGSETGLPIVMHVMNSERPDQYRGVTYLAQIIEPLLSINRYTNSELMAALVESFLTVFIKTNVSADGMPYNVVPGQEEELERYDPNEYEMGPGMINIMNPGESIEPVDPKRPASGFESFVHAIATQMGAALEIPVDLLLKQFNSSYSASRAALLEAWKSFKMYRSWFVSDFCKPIYKLWLSEAIAKGRISAPGFFTDRRLKEAWLGCEWIGPSQGQLDPVKEITAEILAVQNGFTTNEDATIKLNGGDWNANMSKLERETERMRKLNHEENITQNVIGNCIKNMYKEEQDA